MRLTKLIRRETIKQKKYWVHNFMISKKGCVLIDPQTEELVKVLQDLENAASGDAAVRQKIASLPQEVQDVSLLEEITGESHSET